MDVRTIRKKSKVIALVGPTASGKTAASVALAQALNGEIINGDAYQVYQGLSIGTAKIQSHEMQGVPHHLFDCKLPTEDFSVADYQREVRAKIEEITNRNRVPIIVGGTGLYIQAVLYDFRFTEQVANEQVRIGLEEEYDEKGSAYMHERLRAIDPTSAKGIHPNNKRRVIRALEIYQLTGKTKEAHEQNTGKKPLYEAMIFGLQWDRKILYERIDYRVEQMIHEGLEQEVHQLQQQGVTKDHQSMQAIGYKEWFIPNGSLPVIVEQIQKNTRNYAKRQDTYFRNKLPVQWIEGNQSPQKISEEIIKRFEENQKVE